MAPILIAKGKTDLSLLPQMANRHGLIAGATGTGKTVTLQVLAENLSALGVPVWDWTLALVPVSIPRQALAFLPVLVGRLGHF